MHNVVPAEQKIHLYSAITRDIIVMVQPEFMHDASKPDENYYFWAYHVTIENGGNETVQLMHRNWKIIDALGQKMEVSGKGVIGKQPVLRPGESFQYSSGTNLPTPSGMMFGQYTMHGAGGAEFVIDIPGFSLDSAFQKQMVH